MSPDHPEYNPWHDRTISDSERIRRLGERYVSPVEAPNTFNEWRDQKSMTLPELTEEFSKKNVSFLPHELGIGCILPPEMMGATLNAQFTKQYDAMRGMVLTLRTYLLRSAQPQTETTYLETPATWWDHFKMTHFPEWLKRRFPVQMTKTPFEYEKSVRVCPHANFEWPKGGHIEFLTFKDNA